MNIKTYISKMSKAEAEKIATNKGNILGKLLLKNKEISELKNLYIENKIIVLDMTYEPNEVSKKVFKNSKPKTQQIKLIADGSTGGVSYFESGPETKNLKAINDEVQLSVYDDELLIERGKRLARKIIRRQVGGNVSFKLVSIESVFRPYYVAFYGELKEGNKVRYLPIAADGCNTKRTF